MINENKKYSIQEVFQMIGEEYLNRNNDNYQGKSNIEVDGFQVHPISLRYMTFYQKGTKCICCGKEGTYFQLTGDPNTNRRHFNLYADDGTLITKDHIIPASKGGLNKVSNMQTMCEPCNKAKGSECPGYEKEYIIGVASNGKKLCFSTIEKAAYHIATSQCKVLAKSIKKEEAIKATIRCVLVLQKAIDNNTTYGGYTWKKEMR